MKLPNRKQAIIPRKKLTGYLLSETHAVGRFKAKFFRSLGYNEMNIDKLCEALQNIAQSQEVKEKTSSAYGNKYIIDGSIKTSKGEIAKLRTVWILEPDQSKPRFVTAYPL